MGVLLGAALAAAQSNIFVHGAWDDPLITENHPDPPLYGEDYAVDTAIWYDGETTWVYTLGVMTNDFAGAKVFGIYRYDLEDPTTGNVTFFPPNHVTTTVDHIPAALAIDPTTGHVYATGSVGNGSSRDYLTVRFEEDLPQFPDNDWSTDGVETFNGTANGVDFAVDIAVAQEGIHKRAVVTGTATMSGQGTDIYTLVYYTHANQLPGTSWVHWADSLNNDAEDGNETATELATWLSDEQEAVGVVVAVAGTSDNGEHCQDMIACVYDPPAGSTPDRRWSNGGFRLYNGPADGDDVCHGLAAGTNQSQGAQATLCLCGETPKNPPYTGDTEYLVWAIDASTGDDYWESGDYFGGRAWSPAADESGADAAFDIVYGDPSNESPVVWVTGRCRLDGTWDVGTLSYGLWTSDPGENPETASVYDSPAADGQDDRGWAITRSPGGDPFVTGWTETNADPSLLLLEYSQLDGQVTGVGRVQSDYTAQGTAIVYVDAPSSAAAVIVAGMFVEALTDGLEFITARFSP